MYGPRKYVSHNDFQYLYLTLTPVTRVGFLRVNCYNWSINEHGDQEYDITASYLHVSLNVLLIRFIGQCKMAK